MFDFALMRLYPAGADIFLFNFHSCYLIGITHIMRLEKTTLSSNNTNNSRQMHSQMYPWVTSPTLTTHTLGKMAENLTPCLLSSRDLLCLFLLLKGHLLKSMYFTHIQDLSLPSLLYIAWGSGRYWILVFMLPVCLWPQCCRQISLHLFQHPSYNILVE